MQSARSHVAGLEPVPVSRLLEQVKLVLEGTPGLASALVVGEVTSIREVGGHRYFTLKDEEGGQLRCVLFQTQVVRSRIEPGRMYVVGGRVSVYPAQGQLQLYVRDVRPMDVGDLQRRYELLKAKLQSEGLFDQSRKLGLPSWPGRIGIATSATGSVIHDLQSVIGRRFPMAEVVLAPCSVQGIEAPNSIVRSLRALCRVGVDVIVVARGGGAPEDLAWFNDEKVVREVRRVSEDAGIPVVSAVGHETDVTLCDFAADVRAPTPSVAGELIVRDSAEVMAHLVHIERRVSAVAAKVVGTLEHRTAEASGRIVRRVGAILDMSGVQIHALDRRLGSRISARVSLGSDRLGAQESQLRKLARRRVETAEARLETASGNLRLLGPAQVVARGYAIVEDGTRGKVVTTVTDAYLGQPLRLRLRDGTIDATVTTIAVLESSVGMAANSQSQDSLPGAKVSE